MVVQTELLTKLYKRKTVPAVKDFTFEMESGEILAVLGVNGAGKTTLTKMLLGLIAPTSGRALMFNSPISEGKWKGRVGYLPELFQADKRLKATQVLQYLGELSGLPRQRLPSRIRETLELVSLSDEKRKRVAEYSRGMLRRLGLAQALLHEPQLLFLDEPTDGLDPVGRRKIRETLLGLKSKGVSILLNSHLLSEVETIADRIVIINKGELVKQGTLRDVLPTNQGYAVEVPFEPLLSRRWVFRKQFAAWRCEVQSAADLQELLSELNGQSVPVLSITPLRGTLEDAFFAYIQDK